MWLHHGNAVNFSFITYYNHYYICGQVSMTFYTKMRSFMFMFVIAYNSGTILLHEKFDIILSSYMTLNSVMD